MTFTNLLFWHPFPCYYVVVCFCSTWEPESPSLWWINWWKSWNGFDPSFTERIPELSQSFPIACWEAWCHLHWYNLFRACSCQVEGERYYPSFNYLFVNLIVVLMLHNNCLPGSVHRTFLFQGCTASILSWLEKIIQTYQHCMTAFTKKCGM